MEILIRKKCTKCEGIGSIQNQLWTDFLLKNKLEKKGAYIPTHLLEELASNWFKDQYGLNSTLIKKTIPCHMCKGKGKLHIWQPVELKGKILIIKPE